MWLSDNAIELLRAALPDERTRDSLSFLATIIPAAHWERAEWVASCAARGLPSWDREEWQFCWIFSPATPTSRAWLQVRATGNPSTFLARFIWYPGSSLDTMPRTDAGRIPWHGRSRPLLFSSELRDPLDVLLEQREVWERLWGHYESGATTHHVFLPRLYRPRNSGRYMVKPTELGVERTLMIYSAQFLTSARARDAAKLAESETRRT